ncbi:MAG: hypothetical protein R2770_04545 [Acidimicrobiales bacterium]
MAVDNAGAQTWRASAPTPGVIIPPAALTPVRAIVNPSFEVASVVTNPTLFDALNGAQSPKITGWQSTHPPTATAGGRDHPIEVINSGKYGIAALTGDTYIELNAETGSAVFQDLCLQAGEAVAWTAHHHARTGSFNETMQVTITEPADWVDVVPPASPDYSSGPLEARKNEGWKTWTGTWSGPAAAGPYRFAFDVLVGAPTADIGNLLEDISVDLPALVEFYDQPSTNPSLTTESGGAVLSLVVNGELTGPTTLTLAPTAASEITSADLSIGTIRDGNGNPIVGATTSEGANGAISVTLPAGTYWPNDRSAYVQIPLDLVDAIADPNELAEWVVQGPAGVLEAGDALCNGTPDTVHSMTIGAGHDLALAFSTPDAPALGSDVVWEATVSNIDAQDEPGPVSVSVTFSPTYTSLGGSGLGWSCSNNPNSIVCFFINPLNAGDTTPPLTILTTVGGTVGDVANATAVATGVATDVNPANNTVAVSDTVQNGLPGTGIDTTSGLSMGTTLIAAGLALLYLAHLLDLRGRVLKAGMTMVATTSDHWRR